MSAAGTPPLANCAAHAEAYSAVLAPTVFTSSWVTCLPLSFKRAWTSFIRTWRYSRVDLRHPAGAEAIGGGAGACAKTAAAHATAATTEAANSFFMGSLRFGAPDQAESAGRRATVSCRIPL